MPSAAVPSIGDVVAAVTTAVVGMVVLVFGVVVAVVVAVVDVVVDVVVVVVVVVVDGPVVVVVVAVQLHASRCRSCFHPANSRSIRLTSKVWYRTVARNVSCAVSSAVFWWLAGVGRTVHPRLPRKT